MEERKLDLDKLQRTIKVCTKFPRRDCKGCEYTHDDWICLHDELMEDIDKVIEEMRERQWHILREDSDGIVHGLPGDDGQYLMTDGKDIWIDDYIDGVDDGVWIDSGRDVREIKAWMEMPELPEEST